MPARYAVKVTADTNDGDYVDSTSEFSADEYKQIKPVLQRVSKLLSKKDGRWETQDHGDSEEEYVLKGLLDATDADIFRDLVPGSEYGVHTIESIEVYKYSEKKRIF